MKNKKLKLTSLFLFIPLVICLLSCDKGPKEFNVDFNGNGGNLVSGEEHQIVKKGEDATAPVYSREGYSFVEFDKPFTNVTEDLTIKALWNARSFKITLDYQGATGNNSMASLDVKYGENYTLPVPTRSPNNFSGWYTSSSGAGVRYTDADGNSISAYALLANVTLYAAWDLVTNTLTYDYQGADGNNTVVSALVTYGQNYQLVVPTLTDYAFQGWYTSASGGGVQLTGTNGSSLGVWNGSSNITVYAFWAKDVVTVTLDYQGADGGNTVETKKVALNSSFNFPVPTRTRFDFKGWFTEANGGGNQLTGINGASMAPWRISENTTVYASWVIVYSLVTFDYQGADGGQMPVNKLIEIGKDYALPVPTHSRAIFLGWFSQANGEGTEYSGADGEGLNKWTLAADITLYASWNILGVLVAFDYQSATGNMEVTSAVTMIGESYSWPVPTLENHRFYGWFDIVGGKGTRFTNEDGESLEVWSGIRNITVYAFFVDGLTFALNATNDGYICTGIGLETREHVTIPQTYLGLPVVAIGYSAFANSTFTTVALPQSLKSIEIRAFMSSAITYVGFPSSLEKIGAEAFRLCEDLIGIGFDPNPNIKEIGSSAFYKSGLTSVIIPTSVTKIGSSAFSGCADLVSLSIPDRLVSLTIDYQAFMTCGNLTNVFLGEGIVSISYDAFRSTGVTTLNLPSTLTFIDRNAFQNNTKLKYLGFAIGSSNLTMGNYAFADCTSLLGANLPQNLSSIGTYAFSGCTALVEANIPSGAAMASYAFSGCTSLSVVALGDFIDSSLPGVLFLSDGVFENTAISTIVLPSSLTKIHTRPFKGSPLSNVYFSSSASSVSGMIDIGNGNLTFESAKNFYFRTQTVLDLYRNNAVSENYAATFNVSGVGLSLATRYMLVYYTNGGTIQSGTSVRIQAPSSAAASAPTVSRIGYTYQGWTNLYGNPTSIVRDTYVRANWTRD